MRVVSTGVCLAIVLAAFSSGMTGSAQESDTSSAGDSAAIRQVFEDFYTSFSRHDAYAASLCFAEDADFTNMNGLHSRGRADIEKRLAGLFAGNLREVSRTDIVRSIRYLAPNLVTADADTVLIGTRAPDGSIVPPRKGLMIVTMTKQNGRWLILTFHEAEFPRPRGGAPTPAASAPEH